MTIQEGFNLKQCMEQYERSLIQLALDQCDNVRKDMAILLGVKRTTLSMKMMRYGFPPGKKKPSEKKRKLVQCEVREE